MTRPHKAEQAPALRPAHRSLCAEPLSCALRSGSFLRDSPTPRTPALTPREGEGTGSAPPPAGCSVGRTMGAHSPTQGRPAQPCADIGGLAPVAGGACRRPGTCHPAGSAGGLAPVAGGVEGGLAPAAGGACRGPGTCHSEGSGGAWHLSPAGDFAPKAAGLPFSFS